MALRLNSVLLSRLRPAFRVRQISTSKKNSDSVAASAKDECETSKRISDDLTKNWVSYGFDKRDIKRDRMTMHAFFFVTVTIGLIGSSYAFWYAPDLNLKDWSRREAYIQLRKREAAGLPPIDRNLIDPSLVILPSDEELGDTEIII